MPENIVNLTPGKDRYILFRTCRAACDTQCGDCAQCDRACPPDCRDGVKDGTGHTWLVSDRLPIYLIQDVVKARTGVTEAFGRLMGESQDVAERASDLQEAVDFARDVTLTLFRRDYPKLATAHLDAAFDMEGYVMVLTAFLSRMGLLGTARQTTSTPSSTATPTAFPTTTPSATRKQRRSLAS